MRTPQIFSSVLAACLLLGAIAHAQEDPFSWHWYEVENNQVRINLFVFYRDTCPRCKDGLRFAEQMRRRHRWLNVRRYEISGNAGNMELYRRMASSLKRPAGSVPALFYCKQLTLGFHNDLYTANKIEKSLIHWQTELQKQLDARGSRSSTIPSNSLLQLAAIPLRLVEGIKFSPLALAGFAQGRSAADPIADFPDKSSSDTSGMELDLEAPSLDLSDLELDLALPDSTEDEEAVEVPFIGEMSARNLSLPTFTLIIAGCDAFNPCAFFVLLSLLSLLIHARSRGRMLLVGGIFVLFSGLFYFLFMAAWLNVFLLAGHLNWLTAGAGLLAITVALINIKDYFAFKRGVSLSIPESAKPGLFARMRKLVAATALWPMLVGTLALAIAANAYELLCTSGFPMVFTRVLTLRELPVEHYYGYLAFYNLIYVIPLGTIVLIFTFTLGSRKLQEAEGRVLKLLSGVMMILLGLVILAAPSLLHSVMTAVTLLVGSIGVTSLIVVADRWRTRHLSKRSPKATA